MDIIWRRDCHRVYLSLPVCLTLCDSLCIYVRERQECSDPVRVECSRVQILAGVTGQTVTRGWGGGGYRVERLRLKKGQQREEEDHADLKHPQ